MNPYIQDILSQADALRDLQKNYNDDGLSELKKVLESGSIDRVIISGMGSSWYASYPAWLELSSLPVPAMLVNAAELAHYLPGLMGESTLLWLNSQSGKSAEVLRVLEMAREVPVAFVLASVNDMHSPLARGADLALNIHAGPEATVSTKTCLNMLAVNKMTACTLTGRRAKSAMLAELAQTAEVLGEFLAVFPEKQKALAHLLDGVDQLFLLGRGASMAAARTGSLINKEAAKCSFEALNSADFRHGPLEMAAPGLGALIFAGDPKTAPLNRQMALDIRQHGGTAVWLDTQPDPELETFLLPHVPRDFMPIMEMLPMELLTLIYAEKKGLDAGVFKIVGKVTDVE